KDQVFDLVRDNCSGSGGPAMPASGTLSLDQTGTVDREDVDLETLTITVRVGVSIYCFDPEAHGTSGYNAIYTRSAAPRGNTPPQVKLEIAERLDPLHIPVGTRFIVVARASD